MKNLKTTQKTLRYRQTYNGNIKDVFPLLCPVREKDWLEGWDCSIVHSRSGLIEKNCVFTTSHHGASETVWHVTQYDTDTHTIEFIRVTPFENVVRINIQVEELDASTTWAIIDYQYTGLNEEQQAFIESELESTFKESMQWWELAINFYLETGMMLQR